MFLGGRWDTLRPSVNIYTGMHICMHAFVEGRWGTLRSPDIYIYIYQIEVCMNVYTYTHICMYAYEEGRWDALRPP